VVLDSNRQPTKINLRSGGLFSVDVFSQNEIEAVADEPGCQLRLIDNFEAGQIETITHRIKSLIADLDANASKMIPAQQKITAVNEQLRSLPNILEQFKAYGTEGGEDAEAINKAHQLKALRDRETRTIQSSHNQLVELYRNIQTIISQVGQSGAAIASLSKHHSSCCQQFRHDFMCFP
jgi:septation ring formation regulator EzrA